MADKKIIRVTGKGNIKVKPDMTRITITLEDWYKDYGETLKRSAEDTGILATKLYADGSHYDNLIINGGVSTTRTAGYVTMDGKEVFKFAVNALSQAAETVMEMAGVSSKDVDFVIPHQANIRIIEGVGKKLNLPEEKVIVTVDHHGNTSAASIPLALSENYHAGRLKKGDLVVLTAMGAGFTWGGALVRI